MPRLSIIIPCLGGAAEFDGTLVSVLQNRPADCEVLVAHTEPYSDPYSLRGEVQFVHTTAGSLAELINATLEATTGEVIHIIGCGNEVTEGWTTPALTHFDDPEIAAVSPVVLGADRESVAAAGVRWTLGGSRREITDQRVLSRGSGRLRAKIEGPLLTAAFYRRDVILALGGFDVSVGDLADTSVAMAIPALGGLHVAEPASQIVRVNELAESKQHGFACGRAAERLFCRHAASRGIIASLLLHPLAVLGASTRNGIVSSLAGRAVAWLEFGAAARYEQRIDEARERLVELADLRASVRKTAKRGRAKIEPAPSSHRRAA